MGGTHTPDLQVFIPVHHGAELVGYAGSIAHHIDIGGRVPGTESAQSTELYQEGLIFPALKLVEAGERNRALYDLIGGERPRPRTRRSATSTRSSRRASAAPSASSSCATGTAPRS